MFRLVEFAQAFRQHHIDATGARIDFCADISRQRNEQFPLRSVHFEERRSCDLFAGKLNIADRAEQGRSFGKRAR